MFRGLITIDLTTGAGTPVGEYGVGDGASDIAFDAAGNLFGWMEPTNDDLYSINKQTGAATRIGEADISTGASGLAFDNNGILYVEGFGILYTLDPVTGAVTSTIDPGVLELIGLGLTFDSNNTLFGIRRELSGRSLVTIDTTTGTFTTIGSTVDLLDALAFAPGAAAVVPEPTSLSLLGVGGVVVALRRRRKSPQGQLPGSTFNVESPAQPAAT